MLVLTEQAKMTQLYYFDFASFPWKKYSLKVNAKALLAQTCHFPVLKLEYTISDHPYKDAETFSILQYTSILAD